MDVLSDPQIWASLLTLTALEIVLGIDNLVFIALLAGRLPVQQQDRARKAGLALALITRLGLLTSIAWLAGLTKPFAEPFGHPVSWRDVILCLGGLFLLYKGTTEIHERLEGDPQTDQPGKQVSFTGAIGQIMVLDVIFSLDSVITAVGMANQFWVMASAILISVLIMLWAVGPVSSFIARHPTVKMLALSFLLLIGMTLVADGAGFHMPRGYIYAAIGFSVGVEVLNQLAAARSRRSMLRKPRKDPDGKLHAGPEDGKHEL